MPRSAAPEPRGVTLEDVWLEVRALRQEGAALRELLSDLLDERRGSDRAARLSAVDREALAMLLPLVFEARRGQAFLASEVLSMMPAPGRSAKSLGKFLNRVAGAAINGLSIERLGQESNRVLWCVRIAPDES